MSTRLTSDGREVADVHGIPDFGDFRLGYRCAPRPPRPCKVCGETFTPRVHNQLVCDAHTQAERRRAQRGVS
jgi:hypothetical protein